MTRRSVVNIRWYSDDSSDDEKEKKKINKTSKVKSDEALKRLNKLLMSMSTTSSQKVNIITAKQKVEAKNEEKTAEKDPKDLK